MDKELRTWIQERVEVPISAPPRHCLSDRYQPWRPEEAVLFPGLPSFVRGLPAYEEGSERDERHWEYREKENEELDVKRVQLLRETREEYAEPLSGEDHAEKRQAYSELLQQEESMLARAEELAVQIDEQFRVTDPSTGDPSDKLEQAHELTRKLGQMLENRGPTAKLGDTVSAEPEQRIWSLGEDVSSSASWAASHPPHEAHAIVKPLSGSPLEKRPCINVEDVGFDCGLKWLPSDATLEQASKLAELYQEDLRERADTLGNAHALLSFRLCLLQMTLREYELYGHAETWELQDVAEVPRWPDLDIDGSKFKVDIHALLYAISALLGDPDKKDSVWDLSEEKCPVDIGGLHDELMEIEDKHVPSTVQKRGNPLHKGDSLDPLSQQRLGQIVEEFFNPWHLEDLRREADIKPIYANS